MTIQNCSFGREPICSVTFSVFANSHSESLPDERFLYLSETHLETLASLTYRLRLVVASSP